MTTRSPGGPLKTVSLRRRVTWSTIAVLALALAVGGVLVQTLFTVQSSRDMKNQLYERSVTATQMDRAHQPPRQIARQVGGHGIQARLVTPTGEIFGTVTDTDPKSDRPSRTVHLPSGSVLTLVSSNSTTDTQHRLAEVLIAVGLVSLGATALVLVITVRVALRPLDTMTALARSITGGRRGERLRPETTKTELGRTSAAFDEMLDALEGAERQARDSEVRTRRFVADAAHELRTPIAGVQAAAEAVLQAGPEADSDTRDRMQILLVREARRAAHLVEDLLSLARIDAGLELHTEPLDLLALARAEVERTQLLAPSLSFTVDGDPVTVVADSDRLGQVLTNLLDNARRHTPPGGTVEVRVGLDGPGPWNAEQSTDRLPRPDLTAEQSTVRLPVPVEVPSPARREPAAVVTVADSGPGVPAEDRERIFQRLVRLDEARGRDSGGAGLGLAIARGIIRAHHGDLTCVEPAPDTPGAVFRLTLPSTPPM